MLSLPPASALPSVLLSVFSLTSVCIQGSPAVPGCWVIPARISYSSPKCLCASTSTNHMDVWVRTSDGADTGSHGITGSQSQQREGRAFLQGLHCLERGKAPWVLEAACQLGREKGQ